MTRIPLAGAGLLLAGLVLAGCGGNDSAGAGAASSPAVASSAPSSAAPSGAGSATATDPSAGSTPSPGAVTDPCQVLDAATVSELTGVAVKDGTTQAVGSSSVCTWTPKDGTAKDAAVFSAQEGPLPAGLGQVAAQLKTQFNGKVGDLTVAGADDARSITGTTSGLEVFDVLAAKDQRFYQVLVATPRDAEQHRDGAIKIAEALLKA